MSEGGTIKLYYLTGNMEKPKTSPDGVYPVGEPEKSVQRIIDPRSVAMDQSVSPRLSARWGSVSPSLPI